MSNWTKESVQEVVNALVEKASTDEQYRELCKRDIYAAIKEVGGQEVPANFKINVVDNTGYHISITLPELQKANGELGESELENVAGGSKDGANRFFNGLGDVLTDAVSKIASNTNINVGGK